MKKILVILEQDQEDQYALERAVLMAEKLKARVHVLLCCYQELSWINNVFGMMENIHIKEKIIEQKELWWQDYAKPYINTVLISHEVIWSKYFVESILEHCQTHEYDFYVKRGHRSETLFYTPSDWLLLRKSQIPSYIVVEKERKPADTLLLALDFLASSTEKQQLNKKLLEFARDFADKMAMELHCCFAISPPKVLSDTGFIDPEEYSQKTTAMAQETAGVLLEPYRIAQEHQHIKIGSSHKVIANLAQKLNAGAVIIGSMGKSAMSGKVIGNTCEQVLHISKKDVFVLGL
ncbi:universal stress protein [Thalassomonas viridans]|uniref:Universal stress protein n=1 Tax=Thalassomonas viridans TaxID=137584 RepID=A0AAE9YZR7_9GAMM|nr:universal stress protein [Thalassomonas viridans]WDE03440.1 universal stress protein [Thalassomonas viridans]